MGGSIYEWMVFVARHIILAVTVKISRAHTAVCMPISRLTAPRTALSHPAGSRGRRRAPMSKSDHLLAAMGSEAGEERFNAI